MFINKDLNILQFSTCEQRFTHFAEHTYFTAQCSAMLCNAVLYQQKNYICHKTSPKYTDKDTVKCNSVWHSTVQCCTYT